MSKNFDLMQEADVDLEIPRISQKNAAAKLHLHEEEAYIPAALPNFQPQVQEEAAKLVQRIFLLHSGEGPHIVVFAGIDHGEGCSQIAAQAAEILARSVSGSVCLVDANLRSPSLPRQNGNQNHRGLTDALLKDGPIKEFAHRVTPQTLWLLPNGSPTFDSPSLFTSERFKSRLEELRREFDYVLIDAPPLNHYTDAVQVAQMSDGVVLVLEASSTRRETALRIAETLRAAEIAILGAVLNNRAFPIPEPLYRRI